MAFEIGPGPDRAAGRRRDGRLALKIVAEVLEGSTRVTDRVGRVGPATFATVLVGCRLDQTPAFVGRFQAALRRVTAGTSATGRAVARRQALARASSPEVVLKLAEAAAEAPDEQHRGPAGREEASG